MRRIWGWYRGRRAWQQWAIAGVAGFILLVALVPTEEAAPDETAAATAAVANSNGTPSAAPASARTEAATPQSTPTEAPTSAPTAQLTGPSGFGDGTWLVGSDVEPGLYRATDASSCYWARLSGLSGELSDVLANDIGSGFSLVVELLSTDRAFESDGCGTWLPLAGASASGGDEFGDGTWIVGLDIPAGTYRAGGGESCYWSRLSGFSGELSDILANDLPSGGAIVEVLAGDAGFSTHGCGRWERVE